DLAQSLGLRQVNLSVGARTYIQQKVSVSAHDIDEQLNVVLERPRQFIRLVTPRAGDRRGEFPRVLVVEITDRGGACACVEVFGDGGAVVNENLRLPAAEHGVDFLVLPTEPAFVLLALRTSPPASNEPLAAEVEPVLLSTVEPKHVKLPIVGEQLLDLSVILLAHGLCAQALQIGEEEPGEAPIERGIVKPYTQANLANSFHILGDEVTARRGVDASKRVCAVVEKAEAIVMPRGEHDVLHAR